VTRCEQDSRIQDFLDGLLPPGETVGFRAHLAVCPRCAAEVESYRSLIAALEREPLEVPRPELRGRILAHVLPSRVRRRRLVALGLGYAAGLVVTGAGVASWMLGAGGAAALGSLPAWLWRHVLRGGLSALDALGASAVNLATGWSWLEATAGRLAPFSRAFVVLMSDPRVASAVWAAVAVCAMLLWWMRPRGASASPEVRHVGIGRS
jgi:anti-sigma factor RsiW